MPAPPIKHMPMPKDFTSTFDPERFAKQIAFDDLMRGLLIGGVVTALLMTLLLPGLVVVSGLIAPAIVLGLWLWLSVSTARVARSLATFSELMASEPSKAEDALREVLRIRPVMRWARILSYHRLAGLRHLQRRFTETAAICLCLLSQPLKGPAAATRPHLLLMLAEAQLEIGNLPGAYHALAHLQQTKLGLAQSLQRLAIQTRYELAIGAYDSAMHRARAKVELAELMPAKHCATMHAMLATAAQRSGQAQQSDWLWQRTRLLAGPDFAKQLEQGGFDVPIVEPETDNGDSRESV
ncbi:MAG: hypothetical protein AB8C95_14660 [Phycisphaeraceae bacterium]